jgi:S-DNA-T family DNA segregation ATPase FtsK/SpoIIIE
MSTRLFRRPPRRPPPAEPRGELVLDSPPELPETVTGGGGAGQALQMLPMAAGAGSMGLMMAGGGGSPLTIAASGLFGVSMVGMMVGNVGKSSGEKRRRLDGDRRDYQRYLAQARRKVRAAAEQQRVAALWHHPDPQMLWCVVLGSRLWERRPGDADFAAVRVARGSQPLGVSLITPDTKPIEDLEPISAGALRRFVRSHSRVSDLPVALALEAFARISFDGDREQTRALTRAVIAQLITFHSPDDLIVAVCAGPGEAEAWQWLKWVPHALSANRSDGAGQVRLVNGDLIEIESLLGEQLSARPRFTGPGGDGSGPHIVIVLDGGRVAAESQLSSGLIAGVTALDLSRALPPSTGTGIVSLHIDGESLVTGADQRSSRTSALGRYDRLSVVEAESLARLISPLRISVVGEAVDALSGDLTLPDLLRLGNAGTIDTATTWRPRAPRDRLRVPIGVGPDGQQIDLDIKESAQGGMGPHGLVIGATGSGKSELLRTLVLGLAITHNSTSLNFVLIDFKGGATFASLDALPHTSAVITNLADNLTLVDRMKDSIEGEMVRRQELLRDAGNYASLRDYERAREQGAALEPLPSLFVVVDEFSELLSAKPDFIDLFVMIGRLGRSLGVHLLLASQRLEEGRLRGLDTYLSYRVGLRTFSAAESRVVLGVPDAYELPSGPGNGYLKEGTEPLVRFKAAYVSGPYVNTAASVGTSASSAQTPILAYGTAFVPIAEPDAEAVEVVPGQGDGPDVSLMDVIIDRLEGQGQPARQVWLPPLDVPPTLDELLPTLEETQFGLRPSDWDSVPVLTAPVGLVDKPFEQRRDPLWVELATSHLLVAGGPQSGKSTTLRTLITSLSLTHSPQQVQFYCLDFGGGTLSGLADLPHVGSVAGRLEPDRMRRTVAEITTLLDERERVFTERRIDSMASYRRAIATGDVPSDGFGDVFLVVDGWGTVRSDYEQMEAQITQIAGRGLGFGVHVMITVQRWMEIRPALKDLINTRLELRLGDPSESDIDRRAAINVPDRSPGRGLTPAKLHFLVGLPRIDSTPRADNLAEGVADMVSRVRSGWHGPSAPAVRLLPSVLDYAALPVPDPTRSTISIGIDEATLSPVLLDFAAEPHLIIVGDVESGKSNLLRVIARGITTRWTPDQAKIITFDYRRGMLGAITTSHQIGYVMNSSNGPTMAGDIATALKERLAGIQIDPGSNVVPSWGGPQLFLLLDDYDLVASAGGSNPLLSIMEFLPQASDIGLHVILARSAGGVGRGMFDGVMQRIREMGTPGVLLSGSRDEGAVIGSTKMEPLPPGRARFVHRRHGAQLIQTAHLG